MNNVNTKEYWESRFLTNWKSNAKNQTMEYAKANIRNMKISNLFKGSILDFGCACGDAFPVYLQAFPKAKLLGTDISENAIKICNQKYGDIASVFTLKNLENLPLVDIIIASHVMEHISEDKKIINKLLKKCNELYVFVPFKESPLFREHVNYYDENYYKTLNVKEYKTFTVKYKINERLTSILLNLLRLKIILRRDHSKNIIMFRWKNEENTKPSFI